MMKHPRFHAGDLEAVITLLDGIAFARGVGFTQHHASLAALGRLIREHRKVKEFARIENFIEKQRELPLDIGMPLRRRAEKMADWCRDQLEDVT